MKNAVFCLVCLLSLSFFVGCGDMEDSDTATITAVTGPIAEPSDSFEFVPVVDTHNVEALRLRAESIREQLWQGQLKVPPDWDKTEDSLLRAEYARYLLRKGKMAIPFNWYLTKDPGLRAEYERAQLMKQFGDIPEVHTYVDYGKFARLTGAGTVPREEYIALLEAEYKLFPTEAKRLTLQKEKLIPEVILGGPSLEKIRKESPELWAQHKHAQLILQHGNTPQVQRVADFTRKVELELPRTDDECRAFLKALNRIMPFYAGLAHDEYYLVLEARHQLGIHQAEVEQRLLQMFRTAKAEGTPFRLAIDWDELDFD